MAKFLRWKDVEERITLSRGTVNTRIAEGLFPEPIKLGPRAFVWLESEIDRLQEAQIKGLDDAAMRALVVELHKERQA